MSKKVLITGILGQDGATMAEYLLRNTDVEVLGLYRRTTKPNFHNIDDFSEEFAGIRFSLIQGDITDEVSINNVVNQYKPDYLINFAANSFVGCSWEQPVQVFDINTLGVLRCLESIRKYNPNCRFYSAGSSEEMGDILYSPQDEIHPIRPRSPYGASKASARHLVKVYRESYGMYAVHGLLFNHEGIRRGEEFVTRKITKGIARIKKAIDSGKSFKPIVLGNLDSKRDWSDSEDFVDGIWRMLNQEKYRGCYLNAQFWANKGWLHEYVLASGEMHSIREFILEAADVAGIQLKDSTQSPIIGVTDGEGHAVHYSLQDNSPVIVVSKQFYRPAEVNELCGNSNLARTELKWQPKVSFKQLVRKMVERDINLLK